jgi:hypothetical protein
MHMATERERQTDRHDDANVAFCSFANMPKTACTNIVSKHEFRFN